MLQIKCAIFAALFVLSSMARAQFIPFPEPEINSLLIMTPAQMSQFFASKKIDVFKFSDPNEPTSLDVAYDYLATLNQVDRSKFIQYGDLFNGYVMGFYFSRHNTTVDIERDTIVLSNKADRWTIAHETSHALLDQRRPWLQKKNEAIDLENLRNAKEDYEESMRLFRSFGSFPSDELVLRTFDSIKIWTAAVVKFTHDYELEEVRIERYLGSLFETKPQLKLDPRTYQKSFWYVSKNCAMAGEKLKNAREVIEYFSTIISDEHRKIIKDKIGEQLSLMEKQRILIEGTCLPMTLLY